MLVYLCFHNQNRHRYEYLNKKNISDTLLLSNHEIGALFYYFTQIVIIKSMSHGPLTIKMSLFCCPNYSMIHYCV